MYIRLETDYFIVDEWKSYLHILENTNTHHSHLTLYIITHKTVNRESRDLSSGTTCTSFYSVCSYIGAKKTVMRRSILARQTFNLESLSENGRLRSVSHDK
jgi:hypothetical protein